MKRRFGRRNGQTMVEYIIIVVLIAITLLVLFSRLSKATGRKIAGATSALDEEVGGEAQDLGEGARLEDLHVVEAADEADAAATAVADTGHGVGHVDVAVGGLLDGVQRVDA